MRQNKEWGGGKRYLKCLEKSSEAASAAKKTHDGTGVPGYYFLLSMQSVLMLHLHQRAQLICCQIQRHFS